MFNGKLLESKTQARFSLVTGELLPPFTALYVTPPAEADVQVIVYESANGIAAGVVVMGFNFVPPIAALH